MILHPSQRGIELPLKFLVLDFFNLAMVELDVSENYMMKRESEIEQENQILWCQ